MNRLDEIKARLNEVGSHHPDVVVLVAAVEAVLALHEREADGYGGWMCATCLDDERGFDPEREPWPCPTVTAIRDALGEDDNLEPYMPVDDPGCDCEGCQE